MKSGSMDHTCLSAMYNPYKSPSFGFGIYFIGVDASQELSEVPLV